MKKQIQWKLLPSDMGEEDGKSVVISEEWLCETNFRIQKKDIPVLCNQVEGVEALEPITRYKLIVSFGSLFDLEEVQKDFERALLNSQNYLIIKKMPNDEVRKDIMATEAELSCFKYWSMVVIPSGHIKTAVSDCDKEFETLHKKIKDIAKQTNGIILSSLN